MFELTYSERLRARCPSIFSLIAIELNVPRDDLSSIAITLTFVTLGHGLKKEAGSILFDICAPGTRTLLSPIKSLDICITGWYFLLVKVHMFAPNIVIGITFYRFEAGQKLV